MEESGISSLKRRFTRSISILPSVGLFKFGRAPTSPNRSAPREKRSSGPFFSIPQFSEILPSDISFALSPKTMRFSGPLGHVVRTASLRFCFVSLASKSKNPSRAQYGSTGMDLIWRPDGDIIEAKLAHLLRAVLVASIEKGKPQHVFYDGPKIDEAELLPFGNQRYGMGPCRGSRFALAPLDVGTFSEDF